jgi:hypothetical protein
MWRNATTMKPEVFQTDQTTGEKGWVAVRISGWLRYAFRHVNAIGTQRSSVWEVHPITKIEIKRGGQWMDLD